MYYHSFFPWSDLFWVVIIVLIFCVPWGGPRYWRRRYGRYDRNGDGGPDSTSGAESILKERFAKGEITEKEYRERMDVIKDVAKKS